MIGFVAPDRLIVRVGAEDQKPNLVRFHCFRIAIVDMMSQIFSGLLAPRRFQEGRMPRSFPGQKLRHCCVVRCCRARPHWPNLPPIPSAPATRWPRCAGAAPPGSFFAYFYRLREHNRYQEWRTVLPSIEIELRKGPLLALLQKKNLGLFRQLIDIPGVRCILARKSGQKCRKHGAVSPFFVPRKPYREPRALWPPIKRKESTLKPVLAALRDDC